MQTNTVVKLTVSDASLWSNPIDSLREPNRSTAHGLE